MRQRVVYFAQPSGGGAVRIGCTDQLANRTSQLAGAIRGGVEIIATIPGNFYREAVLHGLFDPIRLDRDWFASCPTLWSYLLDVLSARGEWWLPAADASGQTPGIDAVLDRFDTVAAAVVPLGYSSEFSVRQAAMTSSLQGYSLAGRLWAWDVRTGRRPAPSYITDLHARPAEPDRVAS